MIPMAQVMAEAIMALPASSPRQLGMVYELERVNSRLPQVPIATHHLLHAGMYHRTITIPAGVRLTGALIKRATTLTLSGDATFTAGDGLVRLTGYHVIPASAHRKQAFYAHADTSLTMSFPTKAQTVREAEEEFTDEHEMLFSRRGENITSITGE